MKIKPLDGWETPALPDSDKKAVRIQWNSLENKFQNRKILAAGGTSLVGQQLTRQLVDLGADVYVCSDNEEMALKV